MVAKKITPPDILAEARRLYEQTLAPVDDIADMLGMANSSFYRVVIATVGAGGARRRRAVSSSAR